MTTNRRLFIAQSLFLTGSVPLWGEGFVTSSLEKYSLQVNESTLALRTYDGFDEIDGFDSVTGLSLSINGQPSENIPYDPFFEAFKRGVFYDTLDEMLAERPIDGDYTHTLTGTPSGSVTITAPNFPYADAIPVDPFFSFSGVSGTWAVGENGTGRLYFDPATTNTITITMNSYSATTQGGHHAYAVFVNEITNGFEFIDEYSSDLVVDGETPPVPANLAITFTKGLGADGDDDDPTTFGFKAGSRFELEGEHVNIFGLSDAGLGPDVGLKAFVFQTVTAFELIADPDPLADFPTATDIEVTGVTTREGSVVVGWQTTPADAAVDIYRSSDLVSWGSPVSSINASGSYSEPIVPGSRGFFVAVPSGDPYPPAP